MARYLRVAPWELLDQPTVWIAWAQAAQGAEATAREEHTKRAEQRARMKRH